MVQVIGGRLAEAMGETRVDLEGARRGEHRLDIGVPVTRDVCVFEEGAVVEHA